ncbi:MAG: DUF2298 domain-containing protein, partial [Candidatus Binatia bacterium]
AAGALAGWRRRRELSTLWRRHAAEIVAVEAAFAVGFAAFLLVRLFNPAIFWGEKPMDFAILNACLRSASMPPADPWFAGAPLNYFYFGHALVAAFAQISGVPPAFAFNLAIATVGGLLSVAAFLVGRHLRGRILAGAVAAFGVTLLGNLAGPRLLLADPGRSFDFHYFWATSRVIEGTINEFPFWNLVFADLHAHVLAMPFEVALLHLGSLWLAPRPGERRPPAIVVALLVSWFLGAVAATSSWSVPTTVALQLGFLATAWRQRRGGALALIGILIGWGVLVAGSRALFWPFWSAYRLPPGGGWGWETQAAPLADVATIFGPFLVALLPGMLGSLRSSGAAPRGKAIAGIAFA